jgi:fermentation-respiration switch protein FrsA (DUF1100 family)
MKMTGNNKISIAQQLVTRFVQKDFEAVEQSLDESLKQQLPVERLQATWQSLVAQVGEFKQQVGTLSVEQQKELDKLKQQVALVKSPDLSLSTPASELPLDVSPAYWLDLRGYHPEEIAKGLRQPSLILQAEGDYQVTMEDFQIWKDALGGRSNVQFKSYAGLSHLFMTYEGSGKSTPAVYTVPGHVIEEVIQDITKWIKQVI